MSDHNPQENWAQRFAHNQKKDVFHEITVQSGSPYSSYLFYTYRVLMGLSLIVAVIALFLCMNTGFEIHLLILVIICAAVGYLLYYLGNNTKYEYDYTLTNNVLDIAKVINNSQRKKLLSVKMENIQEMAPITSDSFQRYFNDRQIKKMNLFLNRGVHLYFFKTVMDGNPVVVVFEPDTEMVQLMRSFNPSNITI